VNRANQTNCGPPKNTKHHTLSCDKNVFVFDGFVSSNAMVNVTSVTQGKFLLLKIKITSTVLQLNSKVGVNFFLSIYQRKLQFILHIVAICLAKTRQIKKMKQMNSPTVNVFEEILAEANRDEMYRTLSQASRGRKSSCCLQHVVAEGRLFIRGC
jgi:hypothetical protein